ncbi:MAG: 4Fe-4S binding protein [Candidatus Kariarchaeaceae archaeon]|jgi:NADH-quinone oxidoreductase subunit I
MSTVKRYFAAAKEATKNLFSSPKTVMFPSEHVALPANFRGTPILTPENCTLCLRCIRVCPTDAIAIKHIENGENNSEGAINVMFSEDQDPYNFSIDLGRCCYCQACENACRFDAIKLEPEWLTADMNRGELKRSSVVMKPVKKKSKK